MASIYKRSKNGRTFYTVRFYDQHGKRRERTAGPLYKHAEALLNRILLEVNAGTYGVEGPEDPAFSEFCKRFLKAKKREVKASTFDDYQQVIKNHLEPFFKKTHLSKITPALIHDFLEYMENKKASRTKGEGNGDRAISSATIGKTYRYLKVILRYALTLELINRDPTVGIKPPRVKKEEMDYLSVEGVEKLVSTAEGDVKDMLSVATFSGLRQGEILALRWRDINFDAGIIKVVRSYHQPHGYTDLKSTAARRTVPIIPRLSTALIDRYKRKGEPGLDELIFPNGKGKPIDRHNLISRLFEPTLERAGLRRIRFHDLRHTYASLAIAAGMDPKALQRAMGHSSITVTMDTYAHLFPGSYDGALARMEGMFSKGSKVINLPTKDRESA